MCTALAHAERFVYRFIYAADARSVPSSKTCEEVVIIFEKRTESSSIKERCALENCGSVVQFSPNTHPKKQVSLSKQLRG